MMGEPPKNLKYEQNRYIEEEDIGVSSPLYEIQIYDKVYLIAHGKEKTLFQVKNVYYYPIYIISKENKVQCQIGVFEYESLDKNPESRIKRFLDAEGDLDLNRLGDIILYSFVDRDYMTDLKAVQYEEQEIKDIEKEAAITPIKILAIGENIDKHEIEAENIDGDEEDLLTLNVDSANLHKSPSKIASELILAPGIFKVNTNHKMPDTLSEETKEDSKNIKKEFQKTARTTWIENYMMNNNYDIVETAANGDCLFDSIRLAFQQIGQNTTVAILRAILANEATEEVFRQYRDVYMGFVGEKMNIERQMKILQKTNSELKKRIEGEANKVERDKILADSKKVIQDYKVLQQKMKNEEKLTEENRGLLQDFNFMKNIETLEQFREIIKTTAFWADIWAINVLENKLNIKIIPMGEENYKNDPNSVIQCGQIDNEVVEKQGIFNPNFYILVSYSGSHYRLITYKTKSILKYAELPYDIKVLITIKCIEKNGGPFYLIQDFRNFRSTLGLDPDQGFLCDDDEDNGSFDKNTVFVFHKGSDNSKKPGKGLKESITQNRAREFTDLSIINGWRRMLDDDYMIERIDIDGLRWTTATHYIEASKFKKRNPKFYELFSNTVGKGDEQLSHNIEYAKAADSKTGIWVDKNNKSKTKKIRPDGVKKDPDYDGGRDDEEREKALYAKFSQNEDLRRILLSTQNAKLMKFIPKREPEIDCILMKVRNSLQNEIARPEKIDHILQDTSIKW